MKKSFFQFCMVCFIPFLVRGQSTLEYQSGSHIEVTAGADICADNIVINGTYSGDGTQCNIPFPVELISFTATAIEKGIELAWQTATEVNNYGFEVQRSEVSNQKSERNWTKIMFVAGNGTTNSPKDYGFVDAAAKGNVFYRLKQIDNDGKFEYSQEVEVKVSAVPQEFALMQNYPNPFNPITEIGYQIPEVSHVSFRVYDALGREAVTLVNEVKEAGSYKVKFDGSKLSSGTYLCRMVASPLNGVKTYEKAVKMMLVK